MMDEYDKCRFCCSYDEYDGCTNWWCNNKDAFKPYKTRIIEKAKEKDISVADVIALMNMDD